MVAGKHLNFKINSSALSKMCTNYTKHRYLVSYKSLSLTLKALLQMHFWQNQNPSLFLKELLVRNVHTIIPKKHHKNIKKSFLLTTLGLLIWM